jgi:hypothetical protein
MPTNREMRAVMTQAVTDVIPDDDEEFDGEDALEISRRTSEGMIRLLAMHNPDDDFSALGEDAKHYVREALETRIDDTLPTDETIRSILAPS